ncbi:hypothetical protein [Mycobacterium sp. PS03-16]|nr:hypothetical protein [Mycobacterium sp. PS03-16]
MASTFVALQRLSSIDDLGGWETVGPRLFDPENGVVTQYFSQATQ